MCENRRMASTEILRDFDPTLRSQLPYLTVNRGGDISGQVGEGWKVENDICTTRRRADCATQLLCSLAELAEVALILIAVVFCFTLGGGIRQAMRLWEGHFASLLCTQVQIMVTN